MTDGENYFQSLNYSIANEDVSFELDICRQTQPKKILAICGSGARFLPLASVHPQRITALDLAPQQLALAELREVLMKKVSLDDYLKFFGYPPYDTDQHHKERETIFHSLSLQPATRDYFLNFFNILKWAGPLYQGRWEKTFIAIPKLLRKWVGRRYDAIFDFHDQIQQDLFFAKKLRDPLWKLLPGAVLFFIGNATFFNAVLYRGSFVRKNIPGSYLDFYSGVFRRLFANGLTRENFFLQICFLGKLKFPEGNPPEVHPPIYAASQQALQQGTQIDRIQNDVLSFATETSERYDFVSLSNVPSYFSSPAEQNYLQVLARCLNPNALVVVRCYLRIPENTDTLGYEDVSLQYQELAAKEKMQVYRIIVYKFNG